MASLGALGLAAGLGEGLSDAAKSGAKKQAMDRVEAFRMKLREMDYEMEESRYQRNRIDQKNDLADTAKLRLQNQKDLADHNRDAYEDMKDANGNIIGQRSKKTNALNVFGGKSEQEPKVHTQKLYDENGFQTGEVQYVLENGKPRILDIGGAAAANAGGGDPLLSLMQQKRQGQGQPKDNKPVAGQGGGALQEAMQATDGSFMSSLLGKPEGEPVGPKAVRAVGDAVAPLGETVSRQGQQMDANMVARHLPQIKAKMTQGIALSPDEVEMAVAALKFLNEGEQRQVLAEAQRLGLVGG